MASIYDNIKTAKDLISEVMVSGLSTNQEDICRAQDIIGNSTIEELVALANDIGRDDEHGNPDPKGSWCRGRRATQGTFYMVLFHIWNWEQATNFWNLYTNPDREKMKSYYEENAELQSEVEHLKADSKAEHDIRLIETVEKKTALDEVERLKAELHDREMKIMELKAKLYDLMNAD